MTSRRSRWRKSLHNPTHVRTSLSVPSKAAAKSCAEGSGRVAVAFTLQKWQQMAGRATTHSMPLFQYLFKFHGVLTSTRQNHGPAPTSLVSVKVVVPGWPERFVASGVNAGGAATFAVRSRK